MPSIEPRPLRLAVTGREGQVAKALRERGGPLDVEVIALGRPDLDLAKPLTIAAALSEARPDVIVNAAAYTAVDKAESEPGLALEINGAGAGAAAQAAAGLGIPVIQLSTDYVFDGEGERPYVEDDRVAPLGAYGRSKLAGEQAVAAATADHAILRTAWVYSPFGSNFVKTMLRLAANRDTISVVDDQRGCPTSALDIADAILVVARNLMQRPQDASLRGTFHMTGTGEATWAAFARTIFTVSGEAGGPTATVVPIATSAYPTPARRPRNSRLDGAKLAETHGITLPAWTDSLRPCVIRLLDEGFA